MVDESTTQTVQPDALEAAVANAPAPAKKVDLPETPVFGKYSCKGIQVTDVGLAKYIHLDAIGVMHHSARHGNKRFAKGKVHVVERLINDIMRSEVYQGKKSKAYAVVEQAMDRVAEKAKENPVQVLVTAIVNAAPREEITRLRYGGINVPKSVDVSPMRRLDVALRHIAQGATEQSYKSTKHVSQCLADEIMKAAKNDPQSFAVAKRDEVERVAKSAR